MHNPILSRTDVADIVALGRADYFHGRRGEVQLQGTRYLGTMRVDRFSSGEVDVVFVFDVAGEYFGAIDFDIASTRYNNYTAHVLERLVPFICQ